MEQEIRLEGWTGPWPDDDKDANLKSDIALYSHVDPLVTDAARPSAYDSLRQMIEWLNYPLDQPDIYDR